MPEYRLSILHLSDLHARSSDLDELPKEAQENRRGQLRREAASRARVLGDAWMENLRTLYPNDERPDLVCFTGDVADWALMSEYTAATAFVDELVGVLQISRGQVYVVPGNHDVQRHVSRAEWERLRTLLRTDTRATSEWLAGGPPPRAVDQGDADAVMQRTATFWQWVEHGLGRPELLPARHLHQRLGYHHVPALPHLPFEVHIVGFDSAWLAGDDHDHGKLWITEHQVDMLLHDERGRAWEGFRLALIHHPPEHLAQADLGPARRGWTKAADLLLHGHQHDPVGSSLVNLDGDTLRVLAAGCLYEGTEGSAWKNGCQRIDVILDGAGRPLRAEIHFRAWSIRGHWYSDSSLYRGLSDGRLVWEAWGGGPDSGRRDVSESLELLETRDCSKAVARLEMLRANVTEPKLQYLLLKGLGRGHALLTNRAESAEAYRAAIGAASEPADVAVCEAWALIQEKSFEQAQKVVRDAVGLHPEHLELRKLEVLLAPLDEPIESILERLPSSAQGDPATNSALANRARLTGNHKVSERCAQVALAGGEKRPVLYLCLGDAALHPHGADNPGGYQVLEDESERRDVTRAIAAYDAGIAADMGFPADDDVVGHIFMQKVSAMVLLGQPRARIGEVIRAAFDRSPRCIDVRRSYALWLHESGARREAVEYLSALVSETQAPRLLFDLATILCGSKDPADQERAAECATTLVRDPEATTATWIRRVSLRIAVESLLTLDRAAEATVLVKEHADGLGLSAILARASIHQQAGERAPALESLKQAAESWPNALPDELEEVGTRLVRLEAFELAATVFGRIEEARRSKQIDRYHLYALYRAGDARKVLDLAPRYLARHGHDRDVVHMQLDLMELDDPTGAVAIIDRHLAIEPDDGLMRLRRARLGLHFARDEWLEASPEALPDPRSCEPQHGRVAARVLAQAGNPDGALRYAFELFRGHFNSPDARQALLDVIYRANEGPTIPKPVTVEPESAVHLRDEAGRSYAVVLEAGPEPVLLNGEYPPDSAVAQAVIGKTVGDHVELPRGDAWGKRARIESVESKYIFWVRKISQPVAGGVAPDAMWSIPIDDDPKTTIAKIRRIVAANRASLQELLAIYRQHEVMSLHLLAEQLGESTFELMFYMFGDEHEVIRTTAQFEDFDFSGMTLVFDQSALATLVFLGRHADLPALEVPLATSPETAAIVRRLASSPRASRTHLSVTLDGIDTLAGVEYDADYLESARADLQSLAHWFGENIEEFAALEMAELDPERRDAYIRGFGRGPTECITLAKRDHRVLVTDDWLHGQMAAALGVRVLSTMHLLGALHRRELLADDQFLRAKLRLMGTGYLGVGVDRQEIKRAGALAEWDTRAEPLRSVLAVVKNRSISAEARVGVGAKVIHAALSLPGRELVRNYVVDEVLSSARTLGLVDDSYRRLVDLVRTVLRGAARRAFDHLVTTNRV